MATKAVKATKEKKVIDNKLAVIQLGSSQFIVRQGDKIKTEKSDVAKDKQMLVTEVLLYTDDKQTLIGTPTLENISVVLKHLGVTKEKKLRVARFKSKSRYRKVRGHRHQKSEFLVEKIEIKK